jgi:hypothetical protein
MKKRLLFLLFIIFCFETINAQTVDDTVAIEKVILNLFKGMELGDSAMVHASFYQAATTATILRDKNKLPVLRRENSIDGFLKAVGTPHKEKWFEEIWDLEIQVDGDFAQAWCDYAFYADKNFIHCGVDAFHLFKTKAGEWKIFYLADTRRKEGCTIPAEIQERRK